MCKSFILSENMQYTHHIFIISVILYKKVAISWFSYIKCTHLLEYCNVLQIKGSFTLLFWMKRANPAVKVLFLLVYIDIKTCGMFMVLHIALTEVRLICISKSKLFASFNLKTCFTFRIVKVLSLLLCHSWVGWFC